MSNQVLYGAPLQQQQMTSLMRGVLAYSVGYLLTHVVATLVNITTHISAHGLDSIGWSVILLVLAVVVALCGIQGARRGNRTLLVLYCVGSVVGGVSTAAMVVGYLLVLGELDTWRDLCRQNEPPSSLFPFDSCKDVLELRANSYILPITFNCAMSMLAVGGTLKARGLLKHITAESPFSTNRTFGRVASDTMVY